MQHGRIIDDLSERVGGQRELGVLMGGMDKTTICHWKEDGIPARHWPRLLEVAERAGYKLTLRQITSGSPLTAKTSRAA